ncbi:MAG: DNA polymerase I [Rhodobacteraceae bacterium]|nr:DNA polymerase I [Paracoccaceae bacterium]
MGEFGKGCHLQLFDGSGFLFRAFHMAERSLPAKNRFRSDGTPIGAIHFFCNMLLRSVQEQGTDDAVTHAAVVFDYSSRTFRNEIFSEYKAHRPPPPEDLVPQFPLTRDAVRAFNLSCLEMEGYEADDIIATLATQAFDAGGDVTIISSDKDLMQLVGPGIRMLDPMKGTVIGIEEVRAKFFVGPDRVIDVQALAGDSTDNVPGAPGIGIKTAALLINEFGDLDGLLDRAGEIRQPKRRQSLIENAEQIRMSRKLVTLARDVPVPTDLDSLEIKPPEPGKLFEFLQAQEFRTIVKRAAEHLGVEPPDAVPLGATDALPFDHRRYRRVSTIEELDHWIGEVRETGYCAIDTETDSLDEMQAKLIGISLSVKPGEACYIPLRHRTGEPTLMEPEPLVGGQLPVDAVLARLKPLLEDSSILKIGQNIKFDMKIFAGCGISMAPVDDTMLLSFALHAGLHRHSMDELSNRYLDHKPIPIGELIGSGKSQITFDLVPVPDAVRYASEDADITMRLWKKLRPELHADGVTTVYETLERPLIPVIAAMEMHGIKVDRSQLTKLSGEFGRRCGELESQIHKAAGETFNVGSPKQLGEILFDRMKLPGGTRLRSGGYATGARILEDLAAEGHELPSLVLDFRQMAKLRSTYTEALLDHINPATGRVHTSYVIAGANTGRLASTDPNLQNIPVRTEAGRRIREAFVAEDGHVLLSLDYSQIELRILAHVADIKPLKEAFRAGLDIHAMTASQIFDTPVEGMDPMIRRRAKAINFGVIYGISSFGLARDLKISRVEAKDFIDRYFEKFPGIRSYMRGTIETARRNKCVRTLFGRRVHTPGMDEKGPKRGFAERGAINAPIQGSAADVIRRAMIRIPDAIAGLPAKMLVQVHDELLFETREDAVGDVIDAASRVMVEADRPVVRIQPSLVVDSGYAKNWADAH